MKRSLKGIIAATMVLGTAVPTALAATTSGYTDISGNQYASAIDLMTELGVVHGYTDGSYQPSGFVTRGQAVAYVYNILTAQGKITKHYTLSAQPYSDEQAWARTSMNDMYLYGYLNNMDLGNGAIGLNYHTPAWWLSELLCNVAGVSYDSSSHYSALNAARAQGWWDGTTDKTANPNYYTNRDEMAQVLENFYKAQFPDVFKGIPSDLSLSAKDATISTGVSDALTLSGTDVNGDAATLDPTQVSYTVTDKDGNVSSTGFVNAAGNFTATAAGTYTVTATYGKTDSTHPGISTSTTVTVYGSAAAVTLTAANNNVVANGAAGSNKVTLSVVDSQGNVDSNFNGTVDVADTAGWLYNTGTSSNGTKLTAVAVTNGQATIEVSSPNVAGVSDTITANNVVPTGAASALSNVSATLSLSSVAQVATAVKVSAANAVVQDNQATEDDVTVQVVDQSGQPMLTGSYPVSVTVSGPATLYGTSTYTTAYVGNGQSNDAVTLPVMSVQGQTGQVTVSATSGSLTAGSAQISSVVVGLAASLKLVPTGGTSFAAGSNATYTIQALDANGNPTNLPSGTLTASVAGSPAHVNASVAGNTLTVSGTAAGAYSVTVTNGTITSAPAQFSITSGNAAAVAVTAPTATVNNTVYVSQGSPAVTFTAQLQDANGNSVATANVPVVFHVQQTNGSGSYTVNGVAADVYGNATVDTNANGVASVTFAGQPVPGDSWTVQVTSVNGNGGITTTPVTVKMVSVPPTSLSLTATNVTKNSVTNYATAGDSVLYTVYEKDAYGNPYANGDEIQVTLPSGLSAVSGLSTDAAGNNYVTIGNNGSATFTVTAQTAGGQSVSVKDVSNVVSSLSAGETEVVTAGAFANAASLYYNGAAISGSNGVTLSANTPVAVTLVPTDGHGNLAVSGAAQTFTVTDPGFTFRLSPNGADTNSVQIPAGSAGVTVYVVSGSNATYTASGTTVAHQ